MIKEVLGGILIGHMLITDAGTNQEIFILPAPNVGGLPIFQDQIDKMDFVRERTTWVPSHISIRGNEKETLLPSLLWIFVSTLVYLY